MTANVRRPTITDVAQAAGVDRSSVSRAFSRPEALRPQTVATILAAAERLGYAPNHSARALSTGRSGNIAVIVPDIAAAGMPALVRAAQLEADRAGLCTFLGNTDEDPQMEERLVSRFAGQVDGLLLVSPRLATATLQGHAKGKRIVLLGRDLPGIPRVVVDPAQGIEQAVTALSDLGHRRVAYVGSAHTSWAAKLRRSAFLHAATAHGMEVTGVNTSGASHEHSASVRAIRDAGVTAAVAADDGVARGLIAGLLAAGLQVPTDISVLSADELPDLWGEPKLTAIGGRWAEAGKLAIGLLLDTLSTEGLADARYVIETELRIGDTTGPAPVR